MDQDDPLLDAVLGEGADSDVTSFLPTAPQGRTLTNMRLVVLLTVAVLAGLTLWAVKATDALRKADDRATGQAINAAARSAAAPEPAKLDEPDPDQAPSPETPTDPVATPEAEPKPAAPTARPTARPAPKPARITVKGDASELFLLGSAGRFSPGELPAGSYTVQARFEGRGLVEAGQVELSPGAQVTLTCDSGFALCKAQ
jgi:cytoskeletal protein RodZ